MKKKQEMQRSVQPCVCAVRHALRGFRFPLPLVAGETAVVLDLCLVEGITAFSSHSSRQVGPRLVQH